MKPMTRPISLALLLIALTAVAGSSASGGVDLWQPPLAVAIQSNEDVAPLRPNWGTWHSVSGGKGPQGLLLRDGDYMFADDDIPVRYRAGDGQRLSLSFTDWGAMAGATMVTVVIDRERVVDGSAWLKAATDSQLAGLRTLGIGAEIDAQTLPALARLAAVNPTVDLSAESNVGLMQALRLFRPRVVFAPEDLDAGARKALAGQAGIEMLLVHAKDPGSLDFLNMFPKLQTLVLGRWDVERAGPLPAGLVGLKSLLVAWPEGLTDLASLGTPARALEELSLIGADTLKNLSGIEKMTSLHTLLLWGDQLTDVSGVAGLTGLRWVGLPSVSPEQFGAFVAAHPKLAILDMMANETVTDLTPIGTLTDLQGLIVGGPYNNLNAIQTLTSLKFVGVSEDLWAKMPDQVAAVQKALPDALVVGVKPLCLGSGWILLLVLAPVVRQLIRREAHA